MVNLPLALLSQAIGSLVAILVKTLFLLIQCHLSLHHLKLHSQAFHIFPWKFENKQCCTSTRDLIEDAPLIER